MKIEQTIGTILTTYHFRRERLVYATRITIWLAIILVISIIGNIAVISKKTQYRYIMSEITGQVMPLLPLEQPNVDDEKILGWTSDKIAQLNTFDFLNFRKQFQDDQNFLTAIGWSAFQTALQASGNFFSISQNKFVTTAVPNGPAILRKKGILTGNDGTQRFGWQVEIPMIISYRSSVAETSQELNVLVTVVRMPEFINPDGLGIRQILAK